MTSNVNYPNFNINKINKDHAIKEYKKNFHLVEINSKKIL